MPLKETPFVTVPSLFPEKQLAYQRNQKDFQSKGAFSQPRKRLNMLNLMPL